MDNWKYSDRDNDVRLMKKVLIYVLAIWTIIFIVFITSIARAECYKMSFVVTEEPYVYKMTCTENKPKLFGGCEYFKEQDKELYHIICKEKKNVTSKSR